MISVGVISLVIYLLIIIGHGLFRFASKNITASFVLLLGCMGILTMTHSVVANDSALNLIKNASNYVEDKMVASRNCDELRIGRMSSTNTIILRLDDVQAFYLTDVSEKILNDIIERDMKIVAAVIPHSIEEDQSMVRFLRTNLCNIEIAQHGYDHSILEFEDLDYQKADRRIADGRSILSSTFQTPITTFIPPYNVYSEATGQSLVENNFKHISSKGTWQFDLTASTSTPDSALLEPSVIVEACEQKFLEQKPCVIMVHPQDYAVDGRLDMKKFQYFTDLLNYIEDNNIQTSTIKDY